VVVCCCCDAAARLCAVRGMDGIDKALAYAVALVSAAVAALLMYALVHHGLGISRRSIIVDALASAAALSVACVLGRRKRA
jgi:hypothetical protein